MIAGEAAQETAVVLDSEIVTAKVVHDRAGDIKSR